MATNQLSSPSPEEGFSLLEVLIAVLILTIASVTLLQGFELASQRYTAAQERWRAAVNCWNEVEVLRVRSPEEAEEIHVFPGARPLHRKIIETAGAGGFLEWEVLYAEK